MEPSLKEAKYGWNGAEENNGEVFRNSLISSTKLCTAAEFEAISFYFKTSPEPMQSNKGFLGTMAKLFRKAVNPN